MSAAGLTLICLIIRFSITNYVINKKSAQASDVSYFISFLIQAITVVVVSVPEGFLLIFFLILIFFCVIHLGLPLAVTLALAYAVRVRKNKKRIFLIKFYFISI
jgi:magnesium-transporting ATPase (P-type)